MHQTISALNKIQSLNKSQLEEAKIKKYQEKQKTQFWLKLNSFREGKFFILINFQVIASIPKIYSIPLISPITESTIFAFFQF